MELLEWCPLPSSSLPEIDVEGALRGERAVFDGWVPWGEDGEVRWGRERDG